MAVAVEVLIVCSSPAAATGLQETLEEGARAVRCHTVHAPNGGLDSGSPIPDVVILVPQAWEEMRDWLPRLRRGLGSCAWLVLGPLRLAGMFSSFLQGRLCTIVPRGAPPEALAQAFWSLVDGVALLEPESLPIRFAQGLPRLAGTQYPLPPTARELQCGCAVSLGLKNPEIAAALSISEGTVRNHIHALLRKCHVADRRELAAFIAAALPD